MIATIGYIYDIIILKSLTNSLHVYTPSLAFPEGSTQATIRTCQLKRGHRNGYSLIAGSQVKNRTIQCKQQHSIHMVIGCDALPQRQGEIAKMRHDRSRGGSIFVALCRISRSFHTARNSLLQLLLPVLYAPV